jgi:hypothetical protein
MVQLKEKTIEELRKMASKRKIEGRSKMNKSQLVRALSKIKGGACMSQNNNLFNPGILTTRYPGIKLRIDDIILGTILNTLNVRGTYMYVIEYRPNNQSNTSERTERLEFNPLFYKIAKIAIIIFYKFINIIYLFILVYEINVFLLINVFHSYLC